MPNLQQYGIYLVAFPFIESVKHKIRPVIVISEPHGEYGLIIVVPITSKLVEDDSEVQLNDLKTTGLMVASSTQLHRMTAIAENIILKQVGCLNDKDINRVKRALRSMLNL